METAFAPRLVAVLQELQRQVILQRSVDLVLRDGLKPIIREDILSSAKTIYAQN